MASATTLSSVGIHCRDSRNSYSTCSSNSRTKRAWASRFLARPRWKAPTTAVLSTPINTCARRRTSGCRVQNCRKRWLWLICRDNQAAGNTPPAGNCPEVVLTTPPQATEDASDEPFVRDAEKWQARCHGPSCEVTVSANHCLNSTTRSAFDARDRSTFESPDRSSAVEAANMSCVHNDAGRMATDMLMHLPATRCSVRKETSLASSAWHNSCWSLSSFN